MNLKQETLIVFIIYYLQQLIKSNLINLMNQLLL